MNSLYLDFYGFNQTQRKAFTFASRLFQSLNFEAKKITIWPLKRYNNIVGLRNLLRINYLVQKCKKYKALSKWMVISQKLSKLYPQTFSNTLNLQKHIKFFKKKANSSIDGALSMPILQNLTKFSGHLLKCETNHATKYKSNQQMRSLIESQNAHNIREEDELVQDNEEIEEYAYYQDSSPFVTEQSYIFEVQRFIEKIQKEVYEKRLILNASFGWTLMIYDLAGYNPDKLSELLDEDQTWKKIIKYNEEYSLALDNGKCMNCLQTTNLLNNACGHLCCTKCWEAHLKRQYLVRVNLKLFPLCLKEQCNHYMNYQLIAYLKQQSPSLERLYDFILISQYCRANSSFKFCPNLSCGKIIDRSLCKDQNINCSCGLQLCLVCGEQSHQPLQCRDLEIWNSLALIEHEQKAVMKCFACQTVFSLEGNIYIIQCICGQSLCWRCQKAWTEQCTFRTCDVKTFKAFTGAAEIQNNDRHLSCDRYEEMKEFYDRLIQPIKRLKAYSLEDQKQELISLSVLQIDAEILDNMKEFILNAWQVVRRCCIYVFFEREHAEQLKQMMDLINRAAVRADNCLYGSLLTKYQLAKQKASKDPIYGNLFEKQKKSRQLEIKQEFLMEKKGFLHLINEGKHMIELIKKGKINEAYQNANYLKRLLQQGMRRRYCLKINSKS